jgi:transposase-like protein
VALLAVIQEAYVHGVSTRKADDLVRRMGMDGIDKSTVSRICSELDATYVKVREHSPVVSMALVLGIGVREDGYREVLGWEIGNTEDEAFWAEFLRQLVRRGLRGVTLVTSDAHEGLKRAIAQVLTGASWQRCGCASCATSWPNKVPKSAQTEVVTAVRSVFAHPDLAAAGRERLRRVATRRSRLP